MEEWQLWTTFGTTSSKGYFICIVSTDSEVLQYFCLHAIALGAINVI